MENIPCGVIRKVNVILLDRNKLCTTCFNLYSSIFITLINFIEQLLIKKYISIYFIWIAFS